MNIFEIFIFILACFSGYFTGRGLAGTSGLLGWMVGLPLVFFTIVILIGGGHKLMDLWHKFRPLRPKCASGKCSANGYQYQKTLPDGILFKCGCGDYYVKCKNKFLEILPDGTLRPFMKKDWLGRWKPDLGEGVNATHQTKGA